ncbi:MAG: hypothetical protein ACOVQK_00960, partial [Cyanobium sp.]
PKFSAQYLSASALGTIPWGLAKRKKNGVKLIVLGVGRPFLSMAVIAGLIPLVSPSEEGLARTMLMSRLLGTGEMIEAFKNGSGEVPDKLNELAQSTRTLLAQQPHVRQRDHAQSMIPSQVQVQGLTGSSS